MTNRSVIILFEGERQWVTILRKWAATVAKRQAEMELALGAAYGVPVRHLVLCADPPVALWDFHRTQELIACGYEIARAEIARWQKGRRPLQIQGLETVASGRVV